YRPPRRVAVSRLLVCSGCSFTIAADGDLIKRVDRCVKLLLRQMQINRGVFQVRMTQQKLNRAKIRARFQQVRGISMAQSVRANPLAQAGSLRSRLAGMPDGFVGSRLLQVAMAGRTRE